MLRPIGEQLDHAQSSFGFTIGSSKFEQWYRRAEMGDVSTVALIFAAAILHETLPPAELIGLLVNACGQ